MKIKEAESLALELAKALNEKGVVGYKIARNFRMINEELKEYYQKKSDLFQKYGTKDGDNLVIDKNSEGYKAYMEEIAPIEDQEVSFEFRKITEEELEHSELNAQQMMVIIEYFMEV